ncbi:hypothetical protein [Sulfurimonas sp.]
MKIWISNTQASTHRLVKLNCEQHSDYKYLGDLSDEELEEFLLGVQSDMDIKKNINLLQYFGYLHLFVISKD